jgi:hypothetical protein
MQPSKGTTFYRLIAYPEKPLENSGKSGAFFGYISIIGKNCAFLLLPITLYFYRKHTTSRLRILGCIDLM